jgi:ABC-type multidrug transport system fused ATPase/permease subunit
MQLLTNLIFLATVDYVLALVTVSGLAVIFTVQGLKRRASQTGDDYAKLRVAQQVGLENLVQLRTAASSHRTSAWLLARWGALANEADAAMYANQLWANLYNTAFQSMSFLVYVLCIAGIYVRYDRALMSQKNAFAAVGYMAGLVAPINALGSFEARSIWNLAGTRGAMLLFEMTEDEASSTPPSSPSLTTASSSPSTTASAAMPGSSASDNCEVGSPADSLHAQRAPGVAIKNVWFQYRKEAPLFRGLSAEVPPGQLVALYGASGSGKTTLLKLMGHAIASDSLAPGAITVNGFPARRYEYSAFAGDHLVAIDGGTVRENIAFGGCLDSIDDVRSAATLAGIAQVIERMPNGYETVIGRGSNVKLGAVQSARLALARALCQRPRLLLLDEVTEPMDPEAGYLPSPPLLLRFEC